MKARLILIALLVSLPKILPAQTDTLFWFAVPYATLSHDPPTTAHLTLTATDQNSITTVTITQPLNPQIAPIIVTINPAVSLTEHVVFTQADMLKFSNNLFNTKSNSALLIRADREITAYYEIHRVDNNPAIFALKGKNALGYDFWTPFQNQWYNHDYDLASGQDPAFSQIVIVATEDNTVVTIRFKTAAYGYAANVNHTITLNKGQTYMFVPRPNPGDNNEPSTLAADRLIGTHITSNKPIAVTLGDDSVQKAGAYDFMGDQHIPVKNAQNKNVIGYEYIVMKGKMTDLGGGNNEKAYVLATQDNTSITVTRRNGTSVTYGPYAAGSQLAIDLLTAANDFYVHIAATKPVYVLHIAGFQDEMGEAVLPTIDGCTGSLSVSFTRSKTDPFYLNLMTKADAIDSFFISVNNGPPVPFLNASYFEQAGTSDWYVLKDPSKLMPEAIMPTGRVIRVFNTKNVFHLGFFNGKPTGGGCVYGYFSDYNELEASASVEDQGSVFQVCGVDSVELKAKGGISYHWTPTEYLDNPNVQNPILRPPYGGFEQTFRVDIEQPCKGFQSLYVYVIVPKSPNSFMAVDRDKGCAPVSIDLRDASQDAVKYILDLGDGSPVTFSNSPINLTHPYQNNTDSIVSYVLSYTVTSEDGCNDFFSDTISVFPQVISDFELADAGDTTVCHGTTVGFRSTSSGHTDKFLWNFGDGSSHTDTLVNHTFNHFGVKDTVYRSSLIATSPYGCHDTSDLMNIRVFPYIFSDFTLDSARFCSPVQLFVNPESSVGVDTFYWSFSDSQLAYLDSTFNRYDESPVVYPYTNDHNVPDTVRIAMHALNRFGCGDTATTRTVVLYPEVSAAFSIDQPAVCDSVGVLVSNLSSGYNLRYNWDFGNGTSLNDTTAQPFTRYFFNRSGEDTVYQIRLTATSAYFCKDTMTLPLTVHPFIHANFAVDYSNNCSPLLVEINNVSAGGDLFNWDLGDGTLQTTMVPGIFHHTFENNSDHDTTFFIRLLATNAQGCADSVEQTVSLFPQVIAGFNFDSPHQGCNPLTVSLDNTSSGKDLNYFWSFGDHTFSVDQFPPDHQFVNLTDKDTTYIVRLTAMNLAGCDSSITRPVQVYSRVTADFTIERIDSCSPFRLAVRNYSAGGITDFTWKYTENDSMILHSFADPFIPVYRNQTLLPIRHPVELRTSNSHGCTAEQKDSITVYPEVHASFATDISQGCQPLPVSFVNTTNIISGTSFKWDFDDDNFSYQITPPFHVYPNTEGISHFHAIHLEALSQYGCYDDTTLTVEVYPYILAKFTIDKPAICSHEPFIIDRTSSAGAIQTYSWDYEDNGAVDEVKADSMFSHTYPNTGMTIMSRQIRLTVTNPQGCDTSWTEQLDIYPQVRAAFEADTNEACYPMPLSLSNLSEPAVPLTYYWDFGDGSNASAKNPDHVFKNFSRTDDQSFIVSLTATSEYGCDSTVSHTVTIHPKPLADFSFPLAVDCPPFTVPFTNHSMGTSLDYAWDFDNDDTSTLQNPVETFENPGDTIAENNISLMVTTDFGCSDTIIKPIRVYPGVRVDFTASAWNGCNPLEVNLDGTATNENEYYWFIDNKVISNYEDPTYRFVNESMSDKVFQVQFRAASKNGCTHDTTKQIVIYPQPLAEFLPSPQVQDYNTATDITSVTLNNLTNNQSIWGYYWDFGDGTGLAQSAASFVKDYTIWGDIHNENRIPVLLIATNTNHPACSDTMLHYVIINPPLPKVELGPDVSGCMPLTVEFPSTAKYQYPDSYQWDFGYEGQFSGDQVPAPLVYDTAGVYIVRLSVQGDGGTNWDYKKIVVHPKPVVDFSFTPDYAWLRSQNEDGTPIKFFNTTQMGSNYLWEFGDGETSSDFQPLHEYMAVGTYYITLIAESGEGCLDTLTHETPVVIDGRGKLEFPNVITITPNDPADEYYNPGEPDPRIFRPVSEGVDKYKLEIYNRWGELIFTSEEIDKGWNGFIKGSPVKQDVYVWRATATFTNGQPYVKAGDVTVLVRQP
jgi:PKD repeat protein